MCEIVKEPLEAYAEHESTMEPKIAPVASPRKSNRTPQATPRHDGENIHCDCQIRGPQRKNAPDFQVQTARASHTDKEILPEASVD